MEEERNNYEYSTALLHTTLSLSAFVGDLYNSAEYYMDGARPACLFFLFFVQQLYFIIIIIMIIIS
jgi:hypothetical protein